MEPDYWLHGIRGKAGKNIPQAFVRNKGSHHCLINPFKGDISVQGWYDGGGGGLVHSSDEVPVMGMERRDQHVQFQSNQQLVKEDD